MNRNLFLLPLFFVFAVCTFLPHAIAEDVNALPLTADGKTLAEYRFTQVAFKPYVQALYTPAGRNILRDSPWDHVHHHALMFAIYADGVNFWEEHNAQMGREITESVTSPEEGRIVSEILWKNAEDKVLVKETREITVESRPDATVLVWKTTLTPPGDEAVKLGTGNGAGHYHGMGMRFPESMDVGGRFMTDAALPEGETVRGTERLTKCSWMAYTAKLDGEPVTIAVYDLPENTRPMTAFTMGGDGTAFAYISACMDLQKEAYTLQPGETLQAHYRVVVWDGEVSEEVIAAAK